MQEVIIRLPTTESLSLRIIILEVDLNSRYLTFHRNSNSKKGIILLHKIKIVAPSLQLH